MTFLTKKCVQKLYDLLEVARKFFCNSSKPIILPHSSDNWHNVNEYSNKRKSLNSFIKNRNLFCMPSSYVVKLLIWRHDNQTKWRRRGCWLGSGRLLQYLWQCVVAHVICDGVGCLPHGRTGSTQQSASAQTRHGQCDGFTCAITKPCTFT